MEGASGAPDNIETDSPEPSIGDVRSLVHSAALSSDATHGRASLQNTSAIPDFLPSPMIP
jgi:hypothetical protein